MTLWIKRDASSGLLGDSHVFDLPPKPCPSCFSTECCAMSSIQRVWKWRWSLYIAGAFKPCVPIIRVHGKTLGFDTLSIRMSCIFTVSLCQISYSTPWLSSVQAHTARTTVHCVQNSSSLLKIKKYQYPVSWGVLKYAEKYLAQIHVSMLKPGGYFGFHFWQ